MKNFLFSLLLLLAAFAAVYAQDKKAQKIDEFGNLSCNNYSSNAGNFQKELAGSPEAKGYVFVYEGKIKRDKYNSSGKIINTYYDLPHAGEAKAYITAMKQRFDRSLLENITFVEAGFRENFTIEFWIAPKGAEPPQPTPTLKKMNYRKGSPGNFCVNP